MMNGVLYRNLGDAGSFNCKSLREINIFGTLFYYERSKITLIGKIKSTNVLLGQKSPWFNVSELKHLKLLTKKSTFEATTKCCEAAWTVLISGSQCAILSVDVTINAAHSMFDRKNFLKRLNWCKSSLSSPLFKSTWIDGWLWSWRSGDSSAIKIIMNLKELNKMKQSLETDILYARTPVPSSVCSKVQDWDDEKCSKTASELSTMGRWQKAFWIRNDKTIIFLNMAIVSFISTQTTKKRLTVIP